MSRSSCRSFDNTPVPKDTIQNILDKVGLCPNSYGPHTFHTFVVTNKNLINDITNAAQQSWIRTSPLLFVFCSECGNRSYDSKAMKLYNIQDAAIAQTFSMLAIEEEGLGSCWVGGFDQEKVQKILNIPTHLCPVGIQVCGYRRSKASHSKKVPQKSYSFLDSSVLGIHFILFYSILFLCLRHFLEFFAKGHQC
ncbi:uncharacterized protein [Blastocystis hominis]|uniref:Nitroreductase domain-containing protein n=1 Tax=Blastocystis hominis TaxID=12968 RepID=D8LW86_BLAHO|nr:uncharacterized protein [Blastocystis hominis]CBK20075.2 unnamed protein product [Blastocystis hominis]|eukprot:XP_012894123.1 uncharacterized protein [Blastocystis hominis]